MIIREIDYFDDTISDLVLFIHDVLKESKSTFRYFDTRLFACIIEHDVTLLGYVDESPIAYGHLDICPVSGKTWLGVAIGSDYCSNGHGREMVEELLRRRTTPVYLTVDTDNTIARHLYEKVGFELVSTRARLDGEIVEYRIGEPNE